MIISQLIISFFVVFCNTLSIGTVSEHDVIKRAANTGDLFPDWVPFKNKHGEDLGEFVQVVTKNKVKKRLAPPVNFILRAVAEPEGDDYYDKSQGDSDSEDDFEKKEWSDVHRLAQMVEPNQIKLDNHTHLSDIDGLVDILTKPPNNTIVEAIQKLSKTKLPTSTESTDNQEVNEKTTKDEDTEGENTSAKNVKEDKKAPTEEYADYEDEVPAKQKPKPGLTEEEQRENEAKKAKILDSVDELKERHAEEQKAISEKIKEEEIYKEEHERDQIQLEESLDKYGVRRKPNKIVPEYEEYEDKDSVDDKYKVYSKRTETTTLQPKRTSKRRGKIAKKSQFGKVSVFKNPQLYIDESDDVSTSTVKPKKTKLRFSSRYSTPSPNTDDDERISFVPDSSSKEEEPALFFPKKVKSRRRRIKTSTPATDSYVAETVAGKSAATKLATSTDLPKDTASADTMLTDSASSAPKHTSKDTVEDAVPAPSDHKKKEKKNEDYDIEKGRERQHFSEHEESHEEHGKKAYEGHHDDTKTAKGHHDKEDHLGKYNDHGSVDKEHHDESGHYGAHHHEENGKKHAKYEESGKHSKGHSTKGSHDIHKKEEYEKNVEFFEEEGDSAEEEKHGGHNEEQGHSEGGHFKKGNFDGGHESHDSGKSGHFGKGGHYHEQKGHKSSRAHDSHGQHGSTRFNKAGNNSGKKWLYHHGHPAKTANLVAIDRRSAGFYHGPQYYG